MGKALEMAAIVSLAGQIDPTLQKSISGAVTKLKGLNKTALAAGGMVAVGAAASGKLVAAAGKQLLSIGTAATKSAATFEKQMSNVATLLDGDVSGRIKQLNKQVLDVSNTTGIATDDLTDGLYQVISAFGDSADASKQLEIAAKAAKAGNATTTDSINLLSAVTKGYGDTSAKAQQKAADLAFETVKLGQTSFPELAASMGKVIPMASTLSIKQEELFGAAATLTGVTGNTAEVMTQLKATTQGFLSPSKSMAESLKKMGYSSGKALLESKGLQGALDLLKKSVGGNELEFAKLFSSVEAQTAVLAMTGTQSKNLTDKTNAMYKATGAANGAFEAQTDNLEDLTGKLKNMGANFMTELGLNILPYVKEFAEKALPAVQKVLPDVSEALGSMFDAIAPIIPDLADLVVDLLPMFAETLKNIVPFVKPFLSGMVKIIQQIIPKLINLLSTLQPIFDKFIDQILPPILGIIEELLPPLMEIVEAILPIFSELILAILPPMMQIIEAILPVFTELILQMLPFISRIAEAILPVIAELVAAILPILQPIFEILTDLFQSFILPLMEPITMLVEALMPPIQTMLKALAPILKPIAKILEPIGNFIGMIVDAIATVVGWVADGLQWLINLFFGGANEGAADSAHEVDAYAAGGFTRGLSIAGEAGTEAVISFDPAYRSQNIGYWMRAGRLLGLDAPALRAGGSTAIYDVGGVTFAPQITVTGNATKEDIVSAIREEEDEFMDMLEELFLQRKAVMY